LACHIDSSLGSKKHAPRGPCRLMGLARARPFCLGLFVFAGAWSPTSGSSRVHAPAIKGGIPREFNPWAPKSLGLVQVLQLLTKEIAEACA
jgi:hypothetical protein